MLLFDGAQELRFPDPRITDKQNAARQAQRRVVILIQIPADDAGDFLFHRVISCNITKFHLCNPPVILICYDCPA